MLGKSKYFYLSYIINNCFFFDYLLNLIFLRVEWYSYFQHLYIFIKLKGRHIYASP